MNHTFKVPCPNCGGSAIRRYFTSQEAKYSTCPKKQVIQVECSYCDYLMIMCSVSGNVIEAYDSSTSVFTRQSKSISTARIPLSA